MKPRITGKTYEVDIDALEPNPWNPNVQSTFMFAQTRKVIREYGFLDPCTVRSGRPKGKAFAKLQIIDGENRWRAAKEEGLTRVLVEDVGRMSDERAMVLTDILNNLKGENDPLRWAKLLEQVQAQDPGMLQYLPYQQSELDAMLASTQVDWDALGGDNPEETDEDGELFKKFSVSVPTAVMTRAQSLVRKIKAAHGIDSDAAAFVHLLDGYEAHVAAGKASASTTASAPPPPPRARPKATRGKGPAKKKRRTRAA